MNSQKLSKQPEPPLLTILCATVQRADWFRSPTTRLLPAANMSYWCVSRMLDINLLGLKLLKPEGFLVVSSCSHPVSEAESVEEHSPRRARRQARHSTDRTTGPERRPSHPREYAGDPVFEVLHRAGVVDG
jgi:hypothetical protein